MSWCHVFHVESVLNQCKVRVLYVHMPVQSVQCLVHCSVGPVAFALCTLKTLDVDFGQLCHRLTAVTSLEQL